MMQEPLYPYALTGPETELVEILRMAHMAAFSVSTTHRDGRFCVRLINIGASRYLEGSGPSFEEAWRALFGSDLRGMGLSVEERMAALGLSVVDRLTVVEGGRQH